MTATCAEINKSLLLFFIYKGNYNNRKGVMILNKQINVTSQVLIHTR